MSFLGGAECSTAGNPLSQFTKHVHDEQPLHRDRITGRATSDELQGMRSEPAVGGQDALMDGFLQTPEPMLPGSTSTAPLALEHIQRDLDNLQVSSSRASIGSSPWAAEFLPQTEGQSAMEAALTLPDSHGMFSAAEFVGFEPLKGRVVDKATGLNPAMLRLRAGIRAPLPYRPDLGFSRPGWVTTGQSPLTQVAKTTTDVKGKGRVKELDAENWEAQFAQMEAQGQLDGDASARAAMEEELDFMDDSETLLGGEDGLSHEEAFGQWLDANEMGTHGGFLRDPQLGEYLFEDDNPFEFSRDPFGEGMKIMDEAGNLSLAALAFEAAAKRNPAHVEAWTMLGNAQAQNEKETPAIRALEQAIRLDGSHLSALMGLAVSYINEGYESTAYRTLERWLATKYPDVLDPAELSADADYGFTDRLQLHERVTNHFIRAAQLCPDGEHMDPDVQVGLGVLFYGAEEYDKAVDCFSAALASTEAGTSTHRQQVHLLWNRLGATLANSGRSEEAIAAYEKALQHKPNFVRARYNLGVSCINIGCHNEAAQHLLGALAMHRIVVQQSHTHHHHQNRRGGNGRGRGGGETATASSTSSNPAPAVSIPTNTQLDDDYLLSHNQSTNLYYTLRRVFTGMDRPDLVELVGPDMDLERLRGEFDF